MIGIAFLWPSERGCASHAKRKAEGDKSRSHTLFVPLCLGGVATVR